MTKAWIDFAALNETFEIQGVTGSWLEWEPVTGEDQRGEKNHFYGHKHTEEWKRAAQQRMLGDKRNLGKTHRAKTWEIKHPDGTVEEIKNMAAFCRDHNLSKSQMSALGHSKGYVSLGAK